MADVGLPLVVGFLGTGILLIFLGSHLKDKDENNEMANPFLTFTKVLLFAMALFMTYLAFGTMGALVRHNVSNVSLEGNLTNLVNSGLGVTMYGGGFVIFLISIMFVALMFNVFPQMLERRRQER